MKAALHLPNCRCCWQVYLPGTLRSTHGPTAAGRQQLSVKNMSAWVQPPADTLHETTATAAQQLHPNHVSGHAHAS